METKNDTVSGELKQKPIGYIQRQGNVGAIVIGGNFQGLGLIRSLFRQNVPVYLVDNGLCISRFSRYITKYYNSPDVKYESLYLEFLLKLALEKDLQGSIIYPNSDEMVYFLATNKDTLEKYYRITTPPWEITKAAYDKVLTYKLAEKCGITIPNTHYPSNVEEIEQLDIVFPVIIKPSIRQPFLQRMNKKAIFVENKKKLIKKYNQAVKIINTGQTLMIQELIPGGAKNLFSVGSLCRNGELLARVVVQRPRQHPMDFGRSSTFVQTVDIPELEEITKKILGVMGYYGLSEVEFMFDPRDKKYKLIEINARPWGWHTIGLGAGMNLPYLSYLDMLGENVKCDGFVKGVKWFHLIADIPTVIAEVLKGRMTIISYCNSLRGKKQEAVFELRDPIPFIMELVLMPYIWKKRCFY